MLTDTDTDSKTDEAEMSECTVTHRYDFVDCDVTVVVSDMSGGTEAMCLHVTNTEATGEGVIKGMVSMRSREYSGECSVDVRVPGDNTNDTFTS